MNIMTLFQTRFGAFVPKSINIGSPDCAAKLQLLSKLGLHCKKSCFDFIFFAFLLLHPKSPIFSKSGLLISINPKPTPN